MTIDLEAIRQSPRQFCTVEGVEKLWDYAMRLKDQRDELRAALHEYVSASLRDGTTESATFIKARAAIAKAKEEDK